MKNETQNRVVKVSISFPMDFPEDWDEAMNSENRSKLFNKISKAMLMAHRR